MIKKLMALVSVLFLLSGCNQNQISNSSSDSVQKKDEFDLALEKLKQNYTLQGTLTIHYVSLGQQLDFNFELKQTSNAWVKSGYDTYYENFVQIALFKENNLAVYKSLDYTNTFYEQDYIEWQFVSNPFLKFTKDQFVVENEMYTLDLTTLENPTLDLYALTGNEHYYESVTLTIQDSEFQSINIQTQPQENSLGNSLSFEYHLDFINVGETTIEDISPATKKDYPELSEKLKSLQSKNFTITQEIVEGNFLGDEGDLTSKHRYQKLQYYYDDRIILCEYENQGTIQEGYYLANNQEVMYPFYGFKDQIALKSSEANTFADLKPKIDQISSDFFTKKENLYLVDNPSFIQALIPAPYLDASFDVAFLNQAAQLAFILKEDRILFYALFYNEGVICTLRNTIFAIGTTNARNQVNLDSFFTKDGFYICDLFIGTWQGELRDNYTGEYLQTIYTLTFSPTGTITINDEVYTIIDFQESMNEGGVYQIQGTLSCSFYYQRLPQKEEELILTTDDLKYQIKFTRVETV